MDTVSTDELVPLILWNGNIRLILKLHYSLALTLYIYIYDNSFPLNTSLSINIHLLSERLANVNEYK